MEIFVCVVEAGSFSAAARRLRTGQPAVSKAIAQLEARLGTRLLLRSTRGLTPTEAGHSYYEGARKTIAQADDTEHVARGAGASLSGRLRVRAGLTFGRLHVVPKLGAFMQAHPELAVDVVLDDRHIDLLEHGIDVALRLGALDDSSMTARRIAQGRRRVVGTPAFFAAHGEPRSPAELARFEAVGYVQDAGGSGHWVFERDGERQQVTLGGRLQVSAAEGLRAAVLSDLGLAIGSEWMFGAELASGALRAVLTHWQLPPMDLWAVYPSGRLASARARAFVDFVQASLTPA